MFEVVQIAEKTDAQAALDMLTEAWSYYMPEAVPVKDVAQAEGYVDYYADAA